MLTIRDARKHPSFNTDRMVSFLAWSQAGGGWYSKVDTLNFSFPPRRPRAKIESIGDGVIWASKIGVANFVKNFPNPNPNIVMAKRLVNIFGYDFDVDNCLPLVSFSRCNSVEEVQRGIELCLQARKKN